MSIPKYLRKKEDSPSKKGRDQEEKARKHINSGAVFFDKYDLTAEQKDDIILIDVKRSEKTIRLSAEKTEQLHREAMIQHKTPAYLIYLGDYVLKCIIERNPEVK